MNEGEVDRRPRSHFGLVCSGKSFLAGRLILHRQLCWVQFLFGGVFCGEVTLLVIGDGVCGLLEVSRLAAVSLPDLAALGQGAAGLFRCDLGICFPAGDPFVRRGTPSR